MNGGGSLRQSIAAFDGNLGRDVRLDGSVGLHGCEVGDERFKLKLTGDSARRRSSPVPASAQALLFQGEARLRRVP